MGESIIQNVRNKVSMFQSTIVMIMDLTYHEYKSFYIFFFLNTSNHMQINCANLFKMFCFTVSFMHCMCYMNSTHFQFRALRGNCTPRPYFWRLCAFSRKIKQFRTKYPMDLVRNVPRNSKITVLLQWRPLLWSCSEICAKINIFHVLSHKSITTWVSEILVK